MAEQIEDQDENYSSLPISYGAIDELKVGNIRFEGKNKAVFNIGSRYTVVLARERKARTNEDKDYFTIIILKLGDNGAAPLHPIVWSPSAGEDQLALHLAAAGLENAEAIASGIAIIANYFDHYRLGYEAKLLTIKKSGLSIEDLEKLTAIATVTRPTPREELVEVLASLVSKKMYLISEDARKGPLLCYREGVYVECEKDVIAEIERLVEGSELRAKVTNRVVSEVLGKLYRRGVVSKEKIEEDRFYLAFKNGLFNVKRWVFDGVFELRPFDPSIYAVHKIPHRLDIDLFKEIMREEGLGILSHPIDITPLAEKYTPKTWKTYTEWVGDPAKAIVLYEIEGYTLYPDYPLHKAFLLLGEGSNGKSTFLTKLETVLGEWNTVSISLVKLTDPSQRFVIAELYRKLANLAGEVPGEKRLGKLKDPDIFKKLTGQDRVMAERKFRDPFYFVNYAKMIFSANRLPEVDEDTYAWWRRWIGIRFPYQFPEDPTFFDRTFTRREIEAGIIISLFALRNIILRRGFTDTGVNIEDEWKRKSNSVYRFVREMVEAGFLELSARAFVEKQRLYAMYAKWAAEADEKPVSQKAFTQTLKREFGVLVDKKKVRGKTRNVYLGIGIVRDPYEEEDEGEGVLAWS